VPQKQILLKYCGIIDPRNINTYIDCGGFKAWGQARNEMTPDTVLAQIKASGLRGRGGAGFPCGVKWELACKTQANEKFLICNADEGEVGAFKDRHLLQNDPFSLIEGIAIAAYAIGIIVFHFEICNFILAGLFRPAAGSYIMLQSLFPLSSFSFDNRPSSFVISKACRRGSLKTSIV